MKRLGKGWAESARARYDVQKSRTFGILPQIITHKGDFYNRPLAKLSKAVNIADASNQRKAKSETASAVAVAFREDTKPFDKADSVFHKDTLL